MIFPRQFIVFSVALLFLTANHKILSLLKINMLKFILAILIVS